MDIPLPEAARLDDLDMNALNRVARSRKRLAAPVGCLCPRAKLMPTSVLAFTCSDFGRTFQGNGQGSDHGWGNHHMIMGGAVHGKQTYGKFPTLTLSGPDDTSTSNGTGRWIPSTAIDQYFATLATWFGVDSGNLGTVFPNVGRFSTPNLGFV